MREPTVLALLVRSVIHSLQTAGVSQELLLEKSGFRTELDVPEGRVSLRQWMALWNLLEILTDDPLFWLPVADGIEMNDFGLVGHLLVSAPTLGAAGEALVRFGPLLSEGYCQSVTRSGQLTLVREEPTPFGFRHALSSAWCNLIMWIALLRMIPDAASRPVFVRLRGKPVAEYKRLERYCGVPVKFHQRENLLAFPAQSLDSTMPGKDPWLYRYLWREAEAQLAALRDETPHPTLSPELIRGMVAERVHSPSLTLSVLAQQLGITPRTMQRLLRSWGLTYRKLLEDVRRELAEIYLQDPNLDMVDIGYLLGFNDASAFQRAYMKWSGQSPSERRAAAAAERARIAAALQQQRQQ